jgi:hypothetical protein
MTVNFGKLLEDLPAEESAVGTFVTGIEKLVADAKGAGGATVAIADIEALVPVGETVVQDTEAVAKDLGA